MTAVPLPAGERRRYVIAVADRLARQMGARFVPYENYEFCGSVGSASDRRLEAAAETGSTCRTSGRLDTDRSEGLAGSTPAPAASDHP